jgi:hypothetical protein
MDNRLLEQNAGNVSKISKAYHISQRGLWESM